MGILKWNTLNGRTNYYADNQLAYWLQLTILANETGIDKNWWHTVISFETAGSFDPSIKSPKSSATGLIQFLSATANDLGTTTAKLRVMSYEQQFPYVKKYYDKVLAERNQSSINYIEDLYLLIHWPAAVGKPESYILYEKGSKNYAANSGLDTDKKGYVNKTDIIHHVYRRYETLFGVAPNYCIPRVEPDTCYTSSPISSADNDNVEPVKLDESWFDTAKAWVTENVLEVTFTVVVLGFAAYQKFHK